MTVINKETKVETTAVKQADGSYVVDGETFTREEMSVKFTPVKPKEVKPPVIESQVSTETMSESIDKLAKSLVKANGQMSNGKKNKEGYNYRYLTLDSLAEIVRPVLAANGLALTQSHQTIGNKVATHTTLIHESGQWMKSTLEIEVTKSKTLSLPQQVGVICTYSRRYAIQAMFMIVAEEDNDGKL